MANALSCPRKKFLLLAMSTGTAVPLSATSFPVRRAQLFGVSATSATALGTPNGSAVLIGVTAHDEAAGRIVASLPAYDGSLANSLTFDGTAGEPLDLSVIYGVGATGTKILVLCDI